MSLKQEEPSMKRFPLVFLGLAVALAGHAYAFPLGEGGAPRSASPIGRSLKKGPLGESPRLPTLSAKAVSEIDALLQEAVRQGTVPGVVAIVTNKDRVLYHGAFGFPVRCRTGQVRLWISNHG